MFENDLKEFGIQLSDLQKFQFMQYYELLVEWNSFMNLTAITDFDEVMKKHFIDSLSIVKAFDYMNENFDGKSVFSLNDAKCKVIDIGTGAGFPGIPLKIAFPDIKVTLLDSLQKRVKFLDEVIGKLGLSGIDTLHGRAEDYAKPDKLNEDKTLREKYDLCVSRAVANLSTLSELCLPFVKKDGLFISYKSEKLTDELKEAGKAVSMLGGKIEGQVYFELPDSDINRNLLIIRKVKSTPAKFPRKAGLPAKEPIK
ncbi:16S rRNA m(7)G-527 methyltransferase [Kineothrix alysoides]|uniref:Ribosomal RNA small subunit methyltransferase G n=1 Tax=Kineothrix alysoides TaxID=1469948 RepID=A0A4R1QVJ6_9FIRM|nr:16S rRNA (guanine(527)-N(7))-methyltransferase RsmG [Kineothrix alysoides]TCL57273.1 16S rRNA m(7)G-527 methyltransferase [Kineothrix alysoides]